MMKCINCNISLSFGKQMYLFKTLIKIQNITITPESSLMTFCSHSLLSFPASTHPTPQPGCMFFQHKLVTPVLPLVGGITQQVFFCVWLLLFIINFLRPIILLYTLVTCCCLLLNNIPLYYVLLFVYPYSIDEYLFPSCHEESCYKHSSTSLFLQTCVFISLE